MTQKYISSLKGFLGIFILVGCLVWIGWNSLGQVKINTQGRFTIGTTLRSKQTSKGLIIYFNYKVADSLYQGWKRRDQYNASPNGERYFVKFLPSDPSKSRIQWDLPVPAHIEEAPADGWVELPK